LVFEGVFMCFCQCSFSGIACCVKLTSRTWGTRPAGIGG
jgi:hypothetical protein